VKDSQFKQNQSEPKTIEAMQTTFSTTFILRTSKQKDGLTPIYCRITVAGSRSEFSIKRSVAEKSWDTGKVRGNGEEARTINGYLKQVEAKIFEHYRDMLADNKLVTAEGLKNAYLGLRPDESNSDFGTHEIWSHFFTLVTGIKNFYWLIVYCHQTGAIKCLVLPDVKKELLVHLNDCFSQKAKPLISIQQYLNKYPTVFGKPDIN
jgi:hypothetical protein